MKLTYLAQFTYATSCWSPLETHSTSFKDSERWRRQIYEDLLLLFTSKSCSYVTVPIIQLIVINHNNPIGLLLLHSAHLAPISPIYIDRFFVYVWTSLIYSQKSACEFTVHRLQFPYYLKKHSASVEIPHLAGLPFWEDVKFRWWGR